MLSQKIKLLAIAKNWAIKTVPGWCDLSHRDLIARYGATEIDGRISSKSMTEKQINAALDDYHARGWPRVGKKNSTRTMDMSPGAKKIRALWLDLHQRGVVRNPAESALIAYVKRQTGVAALQWLNDTQTARVIESLKAWLQRSKNGVNQ